jgi:hypothetical protein
VLVEHEWAIREREIEKKERDQAGSLADRSGPCSGDSSYRNWQFASFNEQSNSGIEREGNEEVHLKFPKEKLLVYFLDETRHTTR